MFRAVSRVRRGGVPLFFLSCMAEALPAGQAPAMPCKTVGPLLLRALVKVDDTALKPDVGIDGLPRLRFKVAQGHL